MVSFLFMRHLRAAFCGRANREARHPPLQLLWLAASLDARLVWIQNHSRYAGTLECNKMMQKLI
jgi:hypothetical protein